MKCIEDEIPFEVPEGWEWCRFISFSEIITDGTHKTPIYSDTGIIFLSSKNVTKGYIDWNNIMYIPETLHEELYRRLTPRINDILLAKNGTTGIAALVDRDCIFDIYVSLALIRIVNEIILPEYVLYTIATSFVQNYFISSLKGIGVPNLHLEQIRRTLIPIPPYAEQKRISQKLNSLLILCDEICNNKLEIQDLVSSTKTKILDLAIQGKLVPQNPDDEPASVLLERIRAEKEELIKAKKIKRDKKESIIYRGDDNSYYMTDKKENIEMPFNIPETWAWSTLYEMCNYGKCENAQASEINENDWILDLEDIEKDSGKILYYATNKERNTTSTKHKFKKDMVLYSKLRPYLNKVILASKDGYCTSEIIPLKFKECVNPKYAQLFLMSPFFVSYANSCSYGMKMPRLGTTDGQKALFSLPPIDVQNRIVERVNQYFNYLDIIAESIL